MINGRICWFCGEIQFDDKDVICEMPFLLLLYNSLVLGDLNLPRNSLESDCVTSSTGPNVLICKTCFRSFLQDIQGVLNNSFNSTNYVDTLINRTNMVSGLYKFQLSPRFYDWLGDSKENSGKLYFEGMPLYKCLSFYYSEIKSMRLTIYPELILKFNDTLCRGYDEACISDHHYESISSCFRKFLINSIDEYSFSKFLMAKSLISSDTLLEYKSYNITTIEIDQHVCGFMGSNDCRDILHLLLGLWFELRDNKKRKGGEIIVTQINNIDYHNTGRIKLGDLIAECDKTYNNCYFEILRKLYIEMSEGKKSFLMMFQNDKLKYEVQIRINAPSKLTYIKNLLYIHDVKSGRLSFGDR